jgi:hypothetical protein
MADTTPTITVTTTAINPPVEDGWAAARRRLMEGQVWYYPLTRMTNTDNPWKRVNPPVEDGWAAARRRLMEGQVWYHPLTRTTNTDNPWKRK